MTDPWPGVPVRVDPVFCVSMIDATPSASCAVLPWGTLWQLRPVMWPSTPIRARNPAWGLRQILE